MSSTHFRKKSIDEILEKKDSLQRNLSAFDLTMLGVGAIIGAGLFVLTGDAAANYAGPAVSICFLLAALICVFSAFCYAELSSAIPTSGSVYSYTYAIFGRFFAWFIGWTLILEFLLSAATVAGGWSAYFLSLLGDFGLGLPQQFFSPPIDYSEVTGWFLTGNYINIPAICIMAVMGCLVTIGTKAAASVNNILVFLKMGVILIFILLGLSYIKGPNLQPFVPENTGTFAQFGWSGIFRGAGIVFFAYIGFDAIATLAQESKNPQKDLPRAMLGSLGISSFVYAIVAIILVGVVPYKLLGGSSPMAVAFEYFSPKLFWLRPILNLAILAGLTSVVLVMLAGQARILSSMAKDNLLPKKFGEIHPKYNTPAYTTVIVTIFGVLLAGFVPTHLLGKLVSMGTLMGFGFVCLGTLLLRLQQPNLARPFRTPLFPVIPILGAAACFTQMLLLPLMIWIQLGIWTVIGSVVYFLQHQRSKTLVQT